ncbi:hypothetical protein HDZ31DRAFT_68325 [Schizophyllum fasciatum]
MALFLSHIADLTLRHAADLTHLWPLLHSIPTSPAAALALILIGAALLYARRKHAGPARARYLARTALAAHAVLLLHAALLRPPANMYRALGAPLGARPHRLLHAMRAADARALPYGADRLWERFQEEAMVDVYIRYGHDVLLQCEFCERTRDFVSYAAAGAALEYAGAAAVIGLVTVEGTDSEYYRPWGIIGLVATALWEAWQTYTANVEMLMFEDTSQTVHEDLLFRRQIIFLLLPLLLHVLPAALPLDLERQRETLRALRALQEKLKALALCDAAILRSSTLRRLQGAFGDRVCRDVRVLREDWRTRALFGVERKEEALFGVTHTEKAPPAGHGWEYAQLQLAKSQQVAFLATVQAATAPGRVW